MNGGNLRTSGNDDKDFKHVPHSTSSMSPTPLSLVAINIVIILLCTCETQVLRINKRGYKKVFGVIQPFTYKPTLLVGMHFLHFKKLINSLFALMQYK